MFLNKFLAFADKLKKWLYVRLIVGSVMNNIQWEQRSLLEGINKKGKKLWLLPHVFFKWVSLFPL